MIDIIRYCILLAALLFANWANYKAEKDIEERRLNKKPSVNVKAGITDKHNLFVGKALEMHKSNTKMTEEVVPANGIVKTGKLMEEASDQSKSLTHSAAPASVTALREACRNIDMKNPGRLHALLKSELCPMCFSQLHIAGIEKIVYCVPSGDGISQKPR